MPAAWRDVGFFKMCGFKEIVGAPLSEDLQVNRIDDTGNLERESHRLTRTLSSLGSIDLEDRTWWDLRLTEQEHATAESMLGDISERGFVAVNTGGKALQKDWGIQAWEALLRQLGERLDEWGLASVGGREDGERALALADAWPGAVVNLCGLLSPRESAAALSRAALFIGHDSGPFHLADAVGTPAVGIFGDYNKPRMWHPSGSRTRVIHRVSGLKDISPNEVLAGAMELAGLAERR